MNLNIISDQWWLVALTAVVLAAARYGIFAGSTYFFFYKAGLRSLQRFKIQPRPPRRRQVQHELLYSLTTIGVFSLIGTSVFWLYKNGYTTIYLDVYEHGWIYFFTSIVVMILLHDAYFYWTHRLLHTPWFMKHHSCGAPPFC